jgi:hypothetical protein
MKWKHVFKAWHMSRRTGETIKQHDLRKIDEEAQRLANYRARKVLRPDDVEPSNEDGESLPAHVMQDMAFCAAMVRAGYRQHEAEEVR